MGRAVRTGRMTRRYAPRRRAGVVGGALVVAAALVLAACGSGAPAHDAAVRQSSHASTTAPSHRTASGHQSAAGNAAGAHSGTATPGSGHAAGGAHGASTTSTSTTTTIAPPPKVDLVACPTTANDFTSTTVTPPSQVVLSVPKALKGKVVVYGDSQGIMQAVGPKGWSCHATINADETGSLAIYPPGAPQPQGTSYTANPAEGIVVSQTANCLKCTVVQGCPLFPSAAASAQALGYQCPARPPQEVVTPMSAGAIGFVDSPGVAGTGVPSGGQYTARGIMTYAVEGQAAPSHQYNPLTEVFHSASWLETCTLPASDSGLCAAGLNAFAFWYGGE